MFYWNPKAPKCKYKKKVTKIIKISKTKVVLGVNLSIEKKKTSYIISIMNCYQRNGQLRNPDFTYH